MNIEFSVTELALLFTGLDSFIIEVEGRQTDGVSTDLLKRIEAHLDENIGGEFAVQQTNTLAKRLADILKEAL